MMLKKYLNVSQLMTTSRKQVAASVGVVKKPSGLNDSEIELKHKYFSDTSIKSIQENWYEVHIHVIKI